MPYHFDKTDDYILLEQKLREHQAQDALAKMKAEDDHAKMSALLTQSLRYAGIILVPVFILLAVYASASISVVFGTRYAQPETITSLQALAFGLSWLTVFYLLATALSGIGRARTAMWLTVIGFTINTLLNWLFLHAFNNIVGVFETNNLADLAYKHGLEAVKFNPDSFEAWRNLSQLSKTSDVERQEAFANMKRLDPLNTTIGIAK